MTDLALAFVAAFDRRWPSEDELRGLVRFAAPADLLRPSANQPDLDGLIAGIDAARAAACAIAV
jgi:hypothetical protein